MQRSINHTDIYLDVITNLELTLYELIDNIKKSVDIIKYRCILLKVYVTQYSSIKG